MGNRYTVRHGASSPVEYPDKLLKYELGFCDTDEVLYIKNGKAEVKPVAKVLKELSSVPSELYPVSEKVMLDYLAGTTYFQSIAKKIYPVGSIYMSTSSINPQTIFGGTWVAWGQGRVPVGVGTSTDNEDISMSFDSANLNGGYANIRNLSHTHTINYTHEDNFSIASGGAHTHTINHGHSDTFSVASGGSHSHTLEGSVSNHSGSSGSAGSHAHTLNDSVTSYSGSSGSSGVTKENGQNYPPYVTCYMWRRTA